MWIAPVLLVGVVGLGVAGRVGGSGVPSPRASAPPVVAVASSVPAVQAPTVARAPLGIPYQHDRAEGTDGLMGGLAFGLPGDTPLVRRERLNRFTIDDVQHTFSRADRTPPWVRRSGGPPTVSADQKVG